MRQFVVNEIGYDEMGRVRVIRGQMTPKQPESFDLWEELGIRKVA